MYHGRALVVLSCRPLVVVLYLVRHSSVRMRDSSRRALRTLRRTSRFRQLAFEFEDTLLVHWLDPGESLEKDTNRNVGV